MRYKIILVAFALTFGLLLAGHSFVFADITSTSTDEVQSLNKEIADRKDKIKILEDTIDKYKKNIVQKQTQAVSLKNQLSILDNRIAQAGADIELTQEKIAETELEIGALQISIKEKEDVIGRQKKIIASMIARVEANDQKNFLEVLLTYDNFADFYNDVKNTESVYIDIGRSVKSLRLAKEELDAKKQQSESKRAVYSDLKNQLDDKKQTLNEQAGVKQTLLTQTKSSERQYETLLASLKQQYQVIENEERTFEDRLRKKLEAQNKIETVGSVSMSWPAPSHVINATFHDPDYPFKNVFQHSGIDIKAAQGTAVKAAASGYVARARHCDTSKCYAYVLIVHTGNISSLYGHLSAINVADDAFVNRGDVIGYSGGTPGAVGSGPFVTGPHLHFEVRQNGIPVDPMPYLIQ